MAILSTLPTEDPTPSSLVTGLKTGIPNANFEVAKLARQGDCFVSADITKTVGTGQDFTTFDDAIQWLQSIKSLGNNDSAYADKRGLRVTLDFFGETHLPGGANGYWRLENLDFQLSLTSSSATAILGDGATTLQFVNCYNVRIDDITFKGAMGAVDRTRLLVGWFNYGGDYTDCYFYMNNEAVMTAWVDQCLGFAIQKHSYAALGGSSGNSTTIVPNAARGWPVVGFVVDSCSEFWAPDLIVDWSGLTASSATGALEARQGSTVSAGSLTVIGSTTAGDVAQNPAKWPIYCTTGSAININGVPTITDWLNGPNIPVAHTAPDGAAWFDGVTQPQVTAEQILSAESLVAQEPVSLDTAVQVNFGAAQNNPFFDLSAAGTLTCLKAGTYTIRYRFLMGRTGGSQSEAHLFIRATLNANPEFSTPVHGIIDSPRIEIPVTFEGTIYLDVNDVIVVEMMRDSAGLNSGGLYAAVPTVLPWDTSPSALMTITRDLT